MGEVKERGAQSVRTQVHSSRRVCLNPKADFSLWINLKHTIKFTYYVYVGLPRWMHAPQRQGLLCSYNSAWHVVAVQYCEWMDQINKNLKSDTIKHWKRSEEWELSHTANAGANLYVSLKTIWQRLVNLKMYPIILLLVIYALQEFQHRCPRRHLKVFHYSIGCNSKKNPINYLNIRYWRTG